MNPISAIRGLQTLHSGLPCLRFVSLIRWYCPMGRSPSRITWSTRTCFGGSEVLGVPISASCQRPSSGCSLPKRYISPGSRASARISNSTALQQLVEIFWEAATEMEVCIDDICRLFLLGCCKGCVESGTKSRGIAVGLKHDEARDCLISH